MKTRNEAANVLMDAGWSFEEVEAVLKTPLPSPGKTFHFTHPMPPLPSYRGDGITLTERPWATTPTDSALNWLADVTSGGNDG